MLALLLLVFHAVAATCDDLDALELRAARGRLSEDVEACLESGLGDEDTALRARRSFVLILSAYAGRDLEVYGERMDRHLTRFHTTDAEVAYLYARHLWKVSGETGEPPYTAKILRWARVAMDGRVRWLHNRRNYDEMVRNLYDMLVQSSLQHALVQKKIAEEEPTEANRLAADKAQRRARHYLIVAAPCLHRGECGPTFEVIVEGLRECDELGPLENYARGGKLDDGHRACLRGRYRRPASPKRRILEILITDAENHTESDRFEFLLAWYWNVTDSDDPEMAYRFVKWLVGHGGDPASMGQWSEAALEAGRWDAARRTELYTWRLSGWEAAAESARASHASEKTQRTARELATIEERVRSAREARDAWCAEHDCE